MSVRAEAMKVLYRMGRVTITALFQAVSDGVITQDEYDKIIS